MEDSADALSAGDESTSGLSPFGGNQLSTFNGCFVPCLLTILGAVLFLRLGFAVGMMGLAGSLGMLAISELMSCVTVTSFSAMASNGRMKGGGAYYVISRSLGPAFGGAGGLLFWISYSMNATFNVVAVTDILQATLIAEDSWWASRWGSVAISSIQLLPLGLIAYKGAGAFAKINGIVFVALAVACLVACGSLFFRSGELELEGGPARRYSSFSLENLQNNMWPDPVASSQCESAGAFAMGKKLDQTCTPQIVFSVLFPAVVGMMEGLNLSGDLKKPGRSIPLGTFWAILVAFIVYAALMVGQAGTLSREALQYNMDVLQKSTVAGGAFVVLGVITACLSTVLGSLFGAARVLQAIARDKVFPGLDSAGLGYGSPDGDEPRPAVLLSYVLAQAGLFLGNLDDLAPLLTNFFLLTYTLTDFACFMLEVSRVPNFRPTFRFYSWQTSLANSLLTTAVMFYLNAVYAGVTIGVSLLILAFLLHRFRDQPEWIDVRQALFYGWARDSLLALQVKQQDIKFWRPSLLLLIPSSAGVSTPGFLQLAVFLNRVKQSGIFVIGRAWICPEAIDSAPDDGLDVLRTEVIDEQEQLRKSLAGAIPGFAGFQQLAVAPTCRLACYNLVLGAGLGRLLPDIVVLPMISTPMSPATEPREFVQVLRDALSMHKNVLVAANFHEAAGLMKPQSKHVDMWIFQELKEPPLTVPKNSSGIASAESVRQISFLLQLGHLTSKLGDASRLRLLQVAEAETADAIASRWLQWARMPKAVAKTVMVPDMAQFEDVTGTCPTEICDLISYTSCDADVIIALLPAPPEGNDAHTHLAYVEKLSALTARLPPTLLVFSGGGRPVISSDI